MPRAKLVQIVGVLGLGLWLLAGAVSDAPAAGSERRPEAERVRNAARFRSEIQTAKREAAFDIERQLQVGRWKAAIAGMALAWLVHGLVATRGGRRLSPRFRRLRRVALALLALSAMASYYRFSLVDRVPEDMHVREVFHYYLGAKYFRELGYGGLYDCTLASAAEQGWHWVSQLDQVRDLRTMASEPAAALVRRGARECPGRFSPDRWQAFSRDLSWLNQIMDGPTWRAVLLDHGYNPSPVWTLLAQPAAAFAPAQALVVLVHVDTLLVLASLAAVAWAFGFEAACLAAVVWGTGFLWRYAWIGDSFLREIWFAALLFGICCLRREREFAAGALLATSALVRVFPLVFLGGYGLWALIQALRERRVGPAPLRFAAGVVVTVGVLTTASVWIEGRGIEPYQQFARNTRVYRTILAPNMAGLPALLWRLDGSTELYWKRQPRGAEAEPLLSRRAARGVHALCSVVALLGFAWVVRRSRAWEATAAAFILIPIWVAPAGYYFQFVVVAILLATRRPWIAVWTLTAAFGWIVNGLVWRPRPEQYTVVSLLVLALSLAVWISMLRPASDAETQPTGSVV